MLSRRKLPIWIFVFLHQEYALDENILFFRLLIALCLYHYHLYLYDFTNLLHHYTNKYHIPLSNYEQYFYLIFSKIVTRKEITVQPELLN